MLTAEVKRISSIVLHPEQIGPRMLQRLLVVVTRDTILLESLVKKKLSGGVLNVVSGRLRRSIFHKVESTATSVTGRVLQSSDVPYGRIHEFGGTIKHPGGTAYLFDKRVGAPFFVGNDKIIASALPRTKPHDIKMPERSYMRSSLAEMREKIIADMKQAVIEGAKA